VSGDEDALAAQEISAHEPSTPHPRIRSGRSAPGGITKIPPLILTPSASGSTPPEVTDPDTGTRNSNSPNLSLKLITSLPSTSTVAPYQLLRVSVRKHAASKRRLASLTSTCSKMHWG
jgi:hypothetical protein